MSVFKKIKDVLFDIEDDEDTSVSRETTTKVVKENNPIKEVKMPVEDNHDDEISSETPKKNNSFNFPLDFDDDLPSRSDKSSVEPKKNTYNKVNNDLFDDDFDVPRRNREDYIVKETDYNKKEQPRDYSKFLQPKKEEKKIFRPSPVISPVYGVLNQNYTKDDVIVKTDIGVKTPDLDEVRKKAYGVEEKKKKVSKETTKIEVEEDEFTEPLKSLDEILTSKDEDKKIDAEVIEEKDEPVIEETPVNETKEDTLENDLFNLIDSMYEEKNKESEDEE